MTRQRIVAIAVGLVAATNVLGPTASGAVPLGQHLTIVDKTDGIVTGDDWHVTAEVDDVLGLPISGTTVWTGIIEPSLGCGADLTVSDCTKLATTQQTSDANGQLTLTRSAKLNTFVVLYLADSTGALDPATGQSVLVKTHNRYDWSGPSSVTLPQYAVGNTPYAVVPGASGSTHRIATGAGSATGIRTQVSADGGTTWTTVANGTKSGVFPVTGRNVTTVDRVNLMASKPGTYQLRLTDKGGTYEDPGSSAVVTVTVTKRAAPGCSSAGQGRSPASRQVLRSDAHRRQAQTADVVHHQPALSRLHQPVADANRSMSAATRFSAAA